jgi:redox-sensitive bicupin YhaK (pirin superfamily)
MAPPHFAMLWARDIPRLVFTGDAGRRTDVAVVAGRLGDLRGPPPPPRSWAAREDTEVAIWTVRLDSGASWTLPRAKRDDVVRTLYFFRGAKLRVADRVLATHAAVQVRPDVDVDLEAQSGECEILLLQGRPIGEPVVQHGPFVMNTRAELTRAFSDYERTQFGGWPWPSDDPVHPRDAGRFARRGDGSIERGDR